MFAANHTGGSLVYPLIFDNPADDEAFNNIEHTFMLGDALKISPVLDSSSNPSSGNSTHFKSYFPAAAGIWRDIYNFSNSIDSQGQYFDLERKSGQTKVHLKPGKVVPLQKATA